MGMDKTRTLKVSIPHRLPRQEAVRRLQEGFAGVKQQFAQNLAQVEDRWTGDHLDLKATAFGQSITASSFFPPAPVVPRSVLASGARPAPAPPGAPWALYISSPSLLDTWLRLSSERLMRSPSSLLRASRRALRALSIWPRVSAET